jgi:hypothetical protein
MKLNKVTAKQIYSFVECDRYDLARIKELFGKRRKVDALDILRCEEVNVEDRLWVVLRPELLPKKILQLFTIKCAEHVLPIFEEAYPEDARPRKAIETKKKFVEGGATEEELEAARDEAEAANWAAWATRAAWAAWAAWAATWAGEEAAVAAAARRAAWAAADEEQWQFEALDMIIHNQDKER